MERLTIYNNPPRAEWAALTERCTRREEEITEQVSAILAEVRNGGDRALRTLTQRIEGRTPERFEVPAGELQAAEKELSTELKEAMSAAKYVELPFALTSTSSFSPPNSVALYQSAPSFS